MNAICAYMIVNGVLCACEKDDKLDFGNGQSRVKPITSFNTTELQKLLESQEDSDFSVALCRLP